MRITFEGSREEIIEAMMAVAKTKMREIPQINSTSGLVTKLYVIEEDENEIKADTGLTIMENAGFTDTMREIRKHRGLTQADLGRMVGVSATAMTKYERLEHIPKAPILLKIADALNVDVQILNRAICRSVERKTT